MVSLQDALHYISPKSEIRTRQPYTSMVENYPQINLNDDLLSASSTLARRSADSVRSVIVPVNEGVIKRIVRTYFESNFTDALKEARDQRTVISRPWIAAVAEYTHQVLKFFGKVNEAMCPNMNKENIIAEYVETRDWQTSKIRFISWHPNCFKIAVAGLDDIIRVYTNKLSMTPVLKSAHQKRITVMSWRPFASAEIAVGCEKGICIWTIDQGLHITRSSSQETFLTHKNQCPVTALQWNRDGRLLASCSIGSTDLFIWNVDQATNCAMMRIGSPCSILKWSADDAYLFSATINNVFRVWGTENGWIPERWTIHDGRIQAACWSPCSNYLLFITTEEPLLYQLQFCGAPLFATDDAVALKQAVPIADLSNIIFNDQQIGGYPHAIAWDPNGVYLAVSFTDTPIIAILSTSVRKFSLKMTPTSLITGVDDEYPTFICFQSKNRFNSESVLTIGWSSGRIEFFPFLTK